MREMRRRLLLFSGQTGTGKTTVARTVLARLEKDGPSVLIEFDTVRETLRLAKAGGRMIRRSATTMGWEDLAELAAEMKPFFDGLIRYNFDKGVRSVLIEGVGLMPELYPPAEYPQADVVFFVVDLPPELQQERLSARSADSAVQTEKLSRMPLILSTQRQIAENGRKSGAVVVENIGLDDAVRAVLGKIPS